MTWGHNVKVRALRAAAAAVALLIALTAYGWQGARAASAAALQVCEHGCPYSQVAAAVSAANDGDTIDIAPGTYSGGFTIAKNLTLQGSGSSRTTISGGGPVITVGLLNAATEPTVAISGVTITGGSTHTSLGSTYLAYGGGVFVPPAADNAPGATLTVRDSVITHNTVAPSTAVDAGLGSCGPTGDCQFGQAGGGGVDSWGDVTLENSAVTNNLAAGPVTSDADGAGIYSQEGTLTVTHSVVTGNQAIASAPNGRFAEGAGIMFDTTFSGPVCSAPAPTCTFTISDSTVDHNASVLTNSLPSFAAGQLISMGANAGGIHVGDDITTTVQDTTIDGNTASATDLQGEPGAIDAGMIVGASPLTMQGATVDFNRSITTSATSADGGPNGSVFELDGPGTISDTTVSGNLSSSVSPDGVAGTTGAVALLNFTGDPELVTVENSSIDGNTAQSLSSAGTANVYGGGVFAGTELVMQHDQISGNIERAKAPTGTAQGGGIWNSDEFSGPPVQLTLQDSSITQNALFGSPGITSQGAGLFTSLPVTLKNTTIIRNWPDQCVGCAAGDSSSASAGDLHAALTTAVIRAADRRTGPRSLGRYPARLRWAGR